MGVGFGATVGFMDSNGIWVPVKAGSTPLPISGGGGGGVAVSSVNGQTGDVVLSSADVDALPDTYTPTWASVTGKPAVIGAGATQVAARTAIGAGTSNLAVGSAATDAKAGNYQPTWTQVTSKPATVTALPATLGTAGQILAVNAEGTALEWIDPA